MDVPSRAEGAPLRALQEGRLWWGHKQSLHEEHSLKCRQAPHSCLLFSLLYVPKAMPLGDSQGPWLADVDDCHLPGSCLGECGSLYFLVGILAWARRQSGSKVLAQGSIFTSAHHPEFMSKIPRLPEQMGTTAVCFKPREQYKMPSVPRC